MGPYLGLAHDLAVLADPFHKNELLALRLGFHSSEHVKPTNKVKRFESAKLKGQKMGGRTSLSLEYDTRAYAKLALESSSCSLSSLRPPDPDEVTTSLSERSFY